MYRQVSPSENGFAGKPDRMKSSLYEKQGVVLVFVSVWAYNENRQEKRTGKGGKGNA